MYAYSCLNRVLFQAFWRLCLRIQDAVSYFVDVSVPNDIVQSSVSHLHRLYEKKKVAHLIRLLAKAASEFNGAGANLPASESDRLDLLILHVQKLDSSANALVTALITGTLTMMLSLPRLLTFFSRQSLLVTPVLLFLPL